MFKFEIKDFHNLDTTLAQIIHPLLVQFKHSTMSIPIIDKEDVPHNLQTDTQNIEFDRWDWAFDEMLWTFQEIANEYDGENKFYSEEYKEGWEKLEAPGFICYFDEKGHKAYWDRIVNGTGLFGKYFTSLWS